ncbi:MAG: putative GTP-binding protein EngB [Deltaproteobacteria bacterium ADurb.Bin151]|jgi:GTP-binding protein|nr:MAG: putative GTP-binding protein EngB [Deltaproteobacteria bacterium ADurb.Bin151]HNZ11411.1 ribosome biogenesis GTP-binding protein YihA/YsxC [Smithellaceae bacterium]HOG82340.1 ribosome biogenesis GTP-binding protein YihA/YsxC [Smithellaceae bacterium]HOQ42550.1 ribosome biogenesis GTP-binding protein YihA/YsxC [Smithellaceae bacterium]HPL67060.1 ribosome biogenesis GTP-binding protein YihA/YsxC [Smithellaceae bacterium]
MMKITSAEFIKSAVWPPQYPPATLPEIAFVGRSNVGKSSLMNTLVGRKQLAKTSQTPGRTQLINFFSINKAMSFVDLPGYGFARVPRSVKKDWGDMIETYLRERQNLAMVVFILDLRRDPSDDDLSLLDWLEYYRIPFTVILTKSDKLSNNQAIARKRMIEKLLGGKTQQVTMLFSAKTQKGREELWKMIENHLSSLKSR